jgi:hypothetical protein
LINFVLVYNSIQERNSSVQQQFNSFTWCGWFSISARLPPSIRSPGLGFVVLKATLSWFGLGFVVLEGTPEMFTDCYYIKSKRCTCLRSSPKTKEFSVISRLQNSHMHFPTTQFWVGIVDGILLARHSNQWFAVVNSILEYLCALRDKECLDETEPLWMS